MASRTAFSDPGRATTISPGVSPGTRPAEHRGRADLLEAEHPEQLAEPRQPLVEERVDGFERAVAARDAGAAGRDDDVDAGLLRQLDDERGHLAGSSLDEIGGLRRCGRPSVRSSMMARPPVSVASVRVSLTVMTKQRTAAGADGAVRDRGHATDYLPLR